MTCIGEPISWPRLERFARTGDAAIQAHVDACPACARCLDEIRRDVVALPVLVVPERARRRWVWFAMPAFALAAAVVVLLLLRRDETRPDVGGVKGGALAIELVRERGGQTQEGARTFLPGDRWKVLVTCAPGAKTIDVTVADGLTVDRPLAPSQIECGNRIALPGAFSLTGDRPNRICVETACVTIQPE